jgi:hypothetical protein
MDVLIEAYRSVCVIRDYGVLLVFVIQRAILRRARSAWRIVIVAWVRGACFINAEAADFIYPQQCLQKEHRTVLTSI